MDYGRKSDPIDVRPHPPVTARLILAVLILGIIGHLSLEFSDRLRSLPVVAELHAHDMTQARGSEVRHLAHARRLLGSDPLRAEHRLVAITRDSKDPQILDAAVKILVGHAATDWPNDRRGRFIRSVAGPAIHSGRAHRIPPSITIAQAIHESGWGRSSLARNHHNLFGMKASTEQASVMFPTLEYTKAGVRVEAARFRTYESPAESMAEHARLLDESSRYAAARPHAQNWRAYLKAIAPVYATDPGYPRRITQIIERYDLDRWDAVVGPATSTVRPS